MIWRKKCFSLFWRDSRALCNPVRCIFQFSVQFSSSDKWVLLSVGKKKLKLELCLGSLSLLIIYFHENFWTGPGRSGSTQKKSGPSQNWCVFPRKKRKKNSFEKKASKDFLHITPTSIMYISKLFCYKNVHFLYWKKYIYLDQIYSSLKIPKTEPKIKKNVCYFIRNFSCNLIIILLTMLFKFNTDTPKRSPV